MISNLVSFFISAKFQEQPIYEVLAHQDGIHLPTAATRQQGGERRVSHAMRPATEVLNAEMTVQQAMARTQKSAASAWIVTDERGVRGVLSLEMLMQHAQQGGTGSRLEDLLSSNEFVHVHPDHPLVVALERMGASRLDILPVVSRADVRQLQGIVTAEDVLRLYGINRAVGTPPQGNE
jgi:CIC family chloride channel protein